MKHIPWIVLLLLAVLSGCDNKAAQDRVDAERQARSRDMYRVPPPARRDQDKGF